MEILSTLKIHTSDSVYVYNESEELSAIRIWGLEAGFRSLEIYGNTTVSLSEKEVLTNLQVYPNPVKDVLYLNLGKYSALNDQQSVRVFNTQGQLVSEKKPSLDSK